MMSTYGSGQQSYVTEFFLPGTPIVGISIQRRILKKIVLGFWSLKEHPTESGRFLEEKRQTDDLSFILRNLTQFKEN